MKTKILLFFIISLIFNNFTFAQKKKTRKITGKITSNQQILSGVSILVKGLAIDTISNQAGQYDLEIPNYFVKLTFHKIGFISQELEINDLKKTVFDLQMYSDTLQKIWASQQKLKTTKNIYSIDNQVFNYFPSVSFEAALQGKVTGLQILQDNGMTASPIRTQIRGINSLLNSSQPLYVLDGMILDTDSYSSDLESFSKNNPLADLNPSEIERIEVLKDATATAIYGARGANGVILIFSKKGRNEKTEFQANYYVGISNPTYKNSMLSGKDYLKYAQESWQNAGKTGNVPLPNGIDPEKTEETNWQNQIYQQGIQQQTDFSAKGGNEKTTFFVAGGYRNENSFLKTNRFQRWNARLNLTHELAKNLSFQTQISFAKTTQNRIPLGLNGDLANATLAIPFVYENNLLANNLKPENRNSVLQTQRLTANFGLIWQITPVFKFKSELGTNFLSNQEHFYRTNPIPKVTERFFSSENYLFSNAFVLDNSIDDHHFQAVLGMQMQNIQQKTLENEGSVWVNPSLQSLQSANNQKVVVNNYRNIGYTSGFFQFDYSFKTKYLFSAVIRTDYSKVFGENKRFQTFPAVSAGYIAYQANDLRRNLLSFLKVKTSIGITGNSMFRVDNQYVSTYQIANGYNGLSGLIPVGIANPNFAPEKSLQTDLSLEYGFFGQKITGSVGYYQRKTSDLLINSPISYTSGYENALLNLGKMTNSGIEFNLNGNFDFSADFSWKMGLNLTTNQNKVDDLALNQIVSKNPNSADQLAVAGQNLGVWQLAKWAGIDNLTGKELIFDLSGQKIEANQENISKNQTFMGNPTPTYFGGLQNSFSYKGLEINVLFTFSGGNQVYLADRKYLEGGFDGTNNQASTITDRWTSPNQNTNIQQLVYQSDNQNFNTSRYLKDADFWRLRSLSVAYHLPKELNEKMQITSSKIFVSMQNLATFSKLDVDPESNSALSALPFSYGNAFFTPSQAKTLLFGVQVGF